MLDIREDDFKIWREDVITKYFYRYCHSLLLEIHDDMVTDSVFSGDALLRGRLLGKKEILEVILDFDITDMFTEEPHDV